MKTQHAVYLALSVSLALGSSMSLAAGQPVGSPVGLVHAQPSAIVKAPTTPTPRWPGQRPGKLYLGMSCGSECRQKAADLGQSFGVHRQFERWGNWSALARAIKHDHAANRLPWLSIKGPIRGPAGWQAIATGQYDADIRRLASTLKANDGKPVLLTFHHEPSNDASEAQGALWARAYVHLHDLLKSRGALANVADPPIFGDWLFNAANRAQNPDNWVTRAVLQRAPFLGIDMYENHSGKTFAQRIPVITTWMAARGYPHKMIGIGETGSTNGVHAGKSARRWMNESLTWAVRHTDRVGVVSYFNSSANSRARAYWPLNESVPKMGMFRHFLDDSRTIS